MFGGVSLAQAISTTQSWDRTTNTQSDHPSAFASYVQGKDVEPKASPEDMSSEVNYRNRLTRNLTVLTKNYLTHRLNSYLNDNYVTQAVNEQITRYTTNYQHQQLNNTTNTAQNAQAAATTLRNQRPK